MEDKTYIFKIPEKSKKTSKFVTEPYISKNPVLKFLDFFDFNMPYRSRKVFLILFIPSVILALLVGNGGSPDDGMVWAIFFIPIYLIAIRIRRDCKFYGFLGITWLNIGRVLRYTVIGTPVLGVFFFYPLVRLGVLPEGVLTSVMPLTIFILLVAVVNEENR